MVMRPNVATLTSVTMVKCAQIWRTVLIRLARSIVHVKRASSLMTKLTLVLILTSVRLKHTSVMPMPHVPIVWAVTRAHAMSPSGTGMAVIVTISTHAGVLPVQFTQRAKSTLNHPVIIAVHVKRHLSMMEHRMERVNVHLDMLI